MCYICRLKIGVAPKRSVRSIFGTIIKLTQVTIINFNNY